MRVLRPAAGLLISALVVYFLVRGVEWADVRQGLADANPWLIAATLPLLLLLFLARAYRWRLFYGPADAVTTVSAFKALNIGYMAGNVLPLQMGEMARAYALGEMARVSKVRAMSTVAAERIIDLTVLLIAAALLGPWIGLGAPALAGLILAIAAAVIAFGALMLAVIDRGRVERLTNPIIERLPSRATAIIVRMRSSVLDGVSALNDLRTFGAVLAWTILAWTLSAAVIYVLLRAMQVDAPVQAAPLLLIVTTLAFFIPSSPGAVGVYDAAAVAALVTAFDVDRGLATSYALVAHAAYLLPATLLGAWFFWSLHLRLPSGEDDAGVRSPAIDDVTAPMARPAQPT